MAIKDFMPRPYIPKTVITIQLTPPLLKPFELRVTVTVTEADDYPARGDAAPPS